MMRQYELVDRVLAYDPDADEGMLNRAYIFATKMHGSQLRASGDPYFSHPIEVAGILTDLKLDGATIATALLHDTIEDTEATADEIEEHFGAEIAGLVDGVTKLSRLELASTQSSQAENFRKFLVAMSNDIRVLLVKLADRLHNMRTLHFIPSEEKRQRIAQETMDIYAPLAGRMGIQEIRDELEDLAFQVLQPEARSAILKRLKEVHEEAGDTVSNIAAQLRETLTAQGLDVEVFGREKRPYSMWRKMERRAASLEQLSDIFGFRVIVADPVSCYRALGILHMAWPTVPGRFKDYLSTPKNNGYSSLHTTIIGPEKRRVEVQVRTLKMHELAEYGIAAHWLYKDGAGGAENSKEFANTFRWLRQLVEMLEHSSTPEEFLEHTKLQMFSDQVFCFTPKGMLITLPRGATPIDFAYAVHTGIGDRCVGAKVNGRHVPLRSELQNGDEVEIVCSDAQQPLPAWEGIVATGKARSAIRRAARHAKQMELAQLGRHIVRNVFGAANREFDDSVLERALGPLRLAELNDLFVAVGDGTVSGQALLDIVYPAANGSKKGGPARKKSTARQKKSDVSGEYGGESVIVAVTRRRPGLGIRFAEGSFPLPGERIVGILTPGSGIAVYPIDSASLQAFDDEPDRWIDLDWEPTSDDGDGKLFTSRLKICAANQVGALGAITSLVADFGGNIDNLSLTQRDVDFYDMQLDVDVRDLKHLTSILYALKGLSIVESAERVRA